MLENPDGVSGFSQISPDLNLSETAYDHRVALFKRINAKYLVEACNSSKCVESNEIAVSGNLERAVGIFKASNTNRMDKFGNSIAISSDGNTLVVSAPGESSSSKGINGDQQDNSSEGSGAVYVFARENSMWTQQAYIKTSNSDPGDTSRAYFLPALAVSLSADGNVLAVGAPGEGSPATGIDGDELINTATGAGAVYIFERSGKSWEQKAYVKASSVGRDEFYNVVLSADGNTLAVGAPLEDSGASGINGNQDDNSAFDAGAIYVFGRSDSSWQQQAYIKAGAIRKDLFGDSQDIWGTSLTLSGDGNLLAAGKLGGVHIYRRDAGTWSEQNFLDAAVIGADGTFGQGVSISVDGSTLAVSATADSSAAAGVNGNPHDKSPGLRNSGGVYVFSRDDSTWTQQAYIKASNPDAGDRFGGDLSLDSDGDYLAVLARGEASTAVGINGNQNDNSTRSGGGAVYMFARKNGFWQQQAYIKDPHESGLLYSLALASSSNTLAIGAPDDRSVETGINGEHEDFSMSGAGAVFLY